MIHHGAKQQTEYSESLLKSKSAISIEDFLYELYKIHVLYSTLFEIATEIDCFILGSWSLSPEFSNLLWASIPVVPVFTTYFKELQKLDGAKNNGGGG